MKKKITKIIESAIPQQLYDQNEELVNRRKIADKIYDAIPNPERLCLEPFQQWVPIQCDACYYNEAYKLGCTYNLVSEKVHFEHEPPEDCPYGYGC